MKELENAISEKLGETSEHSELMQAMCNLLIILLKNYHYQEKDEDSELMKGMKDRIMNKYPSPNLGYRLMPSPS